MGSTASVRLTPAFVDRVFEESITYRLADSATGESEMVRHTPARLNFYDPVIYTDLGSHPVHVIGLAGL